MTPRDVPLPVMQRHFASAPARIEHIPARLAAVRTGRTGSYLGAALHGSDSDLDMLLSHLRPRLVLWAATRLSGGLAGRVEPDDVAQLTLLAVHRDWVRFTGRTRGEFLAWVFAIGENRIRDLVRYFSALKRAPDGEFPSPLAALEDSGWADDEWNRRVPTTPSQAVVRDEGIAAMRRALSQLQVTHQSVLRMRDLEGRSYEDIRDALELDSVGAARSHRCRALVALRAAMQQEDV